MNEVMNYADDPGAIASANRIRQRAPEADPLGVLPDVHPDRIPRHIAIIMDGNGRWAQQRGFERIFGHQNGAAAVREIIGAVRDLGVEVLTLYSFSTENWKRPAKEISALMELCATYCAAHSDSLLEHGVRFRVIGRRHELPDMVIEAIDALEARTAHCTVCTLCLAINYGSRGEITGAVRSIAERVKNGELEPDEIDETLISDSLDTAGLPDPDLLIRTAGEMRVSNYLLWQISYAELYVTDTLWPDFGAEGLHDAIRAYASRTRRFGGLEHAPAGEEPAG